MKNKILPLTKQEAKKYGSKQYFTGVPCKNGHVAPRYSASGHCSECTKLWQKANPEAMKKIVADWQKANPEKAKARRLRHQAKRPKAATEASLRWQKRHPEKHAALSAARRAKATTRLLAAEERQAVLDKYAFCRMWSALTKIPHHVDHIVPLAKGGKHVVANLQILTAKANISKGAKLDVS